MALKASDIRKIRAQVKGDREEDEERKKSERYSYSEGDIAAIRKSVVNGAEADNKARDIYFNYAREDQAQQAYDRNRKGFASYINALDSLANGDSDQFGNRALTNAEIMARGGSKVNEIVQPEREKTQRQINVDAATRTLDTLSEDTQKKLNQATKYANRGSIGKAEKIYDQLKKDNNWSDQELLSYITDSATIYDNDWRGGAAISNVRNYDDSTTQSRAKDYGDLQHKINTGRTLTDNEQITMAQASIEQLPSEERKLIDRYINAKQAQEDSSVMGTSSKNTSESVKDVLKDIKANTNWDKKTRDKYLDYADRVYNYNADQANLKAWSISDEDSLSDKRWKEIGGSLAKIGNSPYSSLMDFASRAGNNPEGFTADTHKRGSWLANVGEQIQGETSEDIGQHTSTRAGQWMQDRLGQNIGQLAYNSSMAAAESAVSAAIGGLAGEAASGLGLSANIARDVAGLAPFAASGYNSAYDSARERNLSGGAAIAEGIFGGMAEAVTEKVSLDNLWDLAKGTRAGKNLIINALVSAGIEGSEELSSDVINNIADGIVTSISGDVNQFDYLVSQAMEEGATEEEAQQIAKNKILQEAVTDAISGALSGGLSGGGAAVVGARNASNVNKQAQNISSTYSELAANTTDETAREKYQRYADNPYQKMADDITGTDQYSTEAKQYIQDVADRVDAGKKATISDRAGVSESLDIAREVEDVTRKPDKQSSIPEEYRDVRADYSEEEARADMSTAIKNKDSAAFDEAVGKMQNSTDARLRENAESIASEYKGWAESKGLEVSTKVASMSEAYQAGLNEAEFETEDKSLKEAYNSGKARAIEERAKTMVESKDMLSSVKARTQDGSTVTLKEFTKGGIVDTEGKVHKLSDISIDDTGAGNFFRMAAELKTDAARNAFIQNIQDGSVISQYTEEFKRFYKAGQANIGFNKVQGLKMLPTEVAHDIYDTGVKEQNNIAVQAARAVLNKSLNINRGTGTFTDSRRGVHLDDAYLIGRMVANITGLDVELARGSKDNINAQFDTVNSKITVHSVAQMKQIFHEVGEFMQFYNAEGHESLRQGLNEVALNVLGGDAYAGWHDAYMKGYARANDAQSNLDITNEMTNDMFVALMETSKGRKAMAKYIAENVDQSVKDEFTLKLGNMISGVKEAISNIVKSGDKSFQKAVLKKGADQLAEYADKFIEELDKAVKTYQSGEIKTTEEGKKNSIHIEVNPILFDSTGTEVRFDSILDQTRQRMLQNQLNDYEKDDLLFPHTNEGYVIIPLDSNGVGVSYDSICVVDIVDDIRAVIVDVYKVSVPLGIDVAATTQYIMRDIEEGRDYGNTKQIFEILCNGGNIDRYNVGTAYTSERQKRQREKSAASKNNGRSRRYLLREGSINGLEESRLTPLDRLYINHLVAGSETSARSILELFTKKANTQLIKYDKNGKLIPLSKRFPNVKNSVDIGFHAGDLGKAESLAQQGYGRDTGHYGTGTYFVGDEVRISDGSYGARPHFKVDFSKYNLYRPASYKDGIDLHNFLRYVDGFYGLESDAIRTEDEWNSRRESLSDQIYDEEIPAGIALDEAFKLFGKYDTYHTIVNMMEAEGYGYSAEGVYDFNANKEIDDTDLVTVAGENTIYDAIDRLISDNKYAPREVYRIEEFDEKLEDNAKRLFGLSGSEVMNIIGEINDEITAANYDYQTMKTADSAATRFMKKLGYEGINVNDIEGLDNTTYGSVIYDLKGKDLDQKIANGARYSVNIDSEGKELSEDQQEYFKESKVRDALGRLKRVYHGTARADRVGYVFDPDRATSGPMAFFTDDIEIATNYSKTKADTSISRDERYDSYFTQFRVEVDGKDLSIGEYWDELPARKRAEIREKAPHITFDDDYENIIYDEGTKTGLGNFDQYLLRDNKNNYLNALVDSWLNSGDLWNDEARFLEVLQLVGIDNATYLDPEFRDEKVYEVYMNLANPFVTTDMYTSEWVDGLEKWWSGVDQSKYVREVYNADSWDKTNTSTEEWIAQARRDIENNTTSAWTRIPDSITDYLISEGYDGIQDEGGKYHEVGHTVYIPFRSNQIKDINNENPTDGIDIRYSVDVDGTNKELTEGQRKYFKNSKVVDALGRLKVMYHGSNYQFTVFDASKFGQNSGDKLAGIWLSSNPNTAYQYGNNIIEGYVNITNPISLDAKVITADEWISFMDKLGKSDIALDVDFTKHEKNVRFADTLMRNNDSDYDILNTFTNTVDDETIENFYRFVGQTLGFDGYVFETNEGTVAVAFNSEQVKSVSNENPTTAADIRHSVGVEYDDWDAIFAEAQESTTRDASSILEAGMAALKHTSVSESVVSALANKIKKQTGSSIKFDALKENLTKVFAYMQSEDFVDYADMMGILKEVARPVIDNATTKVGEEVYRDFIDRVKGYSIKLTDAQKQEVKSVFGSYGRFRSMMMPMNISDNGSVTLEQVWQELSEASGYMLDYDVTEGEMPTQLYDVLTAMRPTMENTYGADAEEVAQDLAMQIVEEYFTQSAYEMSRQQAQEKANAKAQRRIDNANKKASETIAEVRANAREQVAHAKKEAAYAQRWMDAENKQKVSQAKVDAAEKLKKASDSMREQNKKYRENIKKRYDEQLKQIKKEAKYNIRWRDAENRLATDMYMAEIKARNKKRAELLKEKRLAREQRDKLKSEAGALYKRLMAPTQKKHVPTDMVMPVLDFMTALDFVEPIVTQNADGKWEARIVDHVEDKKPIYETIVGNTRDEVIQRVNEAIYAGSGSKSQRTWTERMRELQDLYDKVKDNADFEDVSMADFVQLLSPDLASQLGDLLTRNNHVASVAQLGSEDLKVLRKVIANVNHAINNADKALANPEKISTLAHQTWETADSIADPKQTPKLVKLFGDLLRQDMMTPKTFMTFLGDAGDTLYKSLREGLNREIHDIKSASKYIEQTKKDLGITEKDIREWTGPHAKISEFTLADGTIRLTPVQIMTLYETSKRAGAQERIIEGIKASDIVQFGKLPLQQKKAYHVNQADIKSITDTLTPQQKAFADALQQYMASDCSKQGNEVSKALYGYEMYEDPTYFPYTVDKNSVASTEKTISDRSMTGEHAGFTNPLKKGASNVLVMDDIFKVFSRHVAEMSKYHGYTVANKDVVRWLNYKEFDDTNGRTRITVKDSINKLSRSDAGVTYIENVLADIAGSGAAGTKAGKVIDTIASGFKASAVMGNLRVVFQQPTAYFRAMNMVSPKYLFTVNVAKAFKDVERVNELSDIAWWKAQGYFETNIGQSLESVINGQQTFRDKINDKAGWLAGKADDVTWSLLYQAIEKEQRAMLGNVDPETYRKAVNARFDEVVDSTQVVDATLLRSQYMRDKDGLAKLQTAFMAEPTKTYNMLAEAVIKDYRDIKAGKKAGARTARAITAFTVSSLATAAAAAIMDAVRYDDDDEKWNEIWLQNFIKNFIDNENPLNLIPWVKDIWAEIEKNISGDKFNSNLSRYDLDAILGTVDVMLVEIPKIFSGESNKTGYGKLMTFVKPLSQLFGIPAYSVMRDLTATYNLIGNQFEAGIRSDYPTNSTYKNSFMNVDPLEEPDRKVGEAIDSLEGGVSVYDLLNKIQSTYKEDYVTAIDTEDYDTATDIRNNVYITYNLLGLKPEDAQETLDKWLEESGGYSALDKAINSVAAKGQFSDNDYQYLSEEMAKVMELKETDKIMEHLVDKFGSTVAFEDTHDTESEYRDTLDQITAMLDDTWDYDYVKQTVDEVKEERARKAAEKAEKAERKSALVKIINDGGDYQSAIDDMLGSGTEAKTIKQNLTSEYKAKYIEAVKNKDYTTANDIQRKVAQAKAYADKKSNFKLANKWNGDYYQYELEEIKTGWVEKKE